MAGFRDLPLLLCQHSVCSRGALGNCSDLCLLVRNSCAVQQKRLSPLTARNSPDCQDMMETTYVEEIQKHIRVWVKRVSYDFGFSSSNWFIAQTWDFCDQLRPSTSRLCCWFIYTRTAALSIDNGAVATFQQSYLFRALQTGLLSPATASFQGLQVENVHRTWRGRCRRHLHQRCRL